MRNERIWFLERELISAQDAKEDVKLLLRKFKYVKRYFGDKLNEELKSVLEAV